MADIQLVNGETYTFKVPARNTSYFNDGSLAPANLSVELLLKAGDTVLFDNTQPYNFAANELHNFSFTVPIDVPDNIYGAESASAFLIAPDGMVIKQVSKSMFIEIPAFIPAYPFEFPIYPALPGGQVRYVAPIPGFTALPGSAITIWAINFPSSVIQWYAKIFDPSMGWSENYFQNPDDNKNWRPISDPCGFRVPRAESEVPEYGPGETNIVINAGPMSQDYGGQYGPIAGSSKLTVKSGDVVIFNYTDKTFTVPRV